MIISQLKFSTHYVGHPPRKHWPHPGISSCLISDPWSSVWCTTIMTHSLGSVTSWSLLSSLDRKCTGTTPGQAIRNRRVIPKSLNALRLTDSSLLEQPIASRIMSRISFAFAQRSRHHIDFTSWTNDGWMMRQIPHGTRIGVDRTKVTSRRISISPIRLLITVFDS
jgi:hypothetical protein